jgi:hypothetical protein
VVTAETEVQITPDQGDNKMKGVIFLSVFGFVFINLTGCYTIPRHYTQQVEVVGHTPVDTLFRPEPIIYPEPPPSPSVYYPPTTDTNPQRDRIPEKPKDSYGQRDPLQGGSDRDRGGIKTDPPVRNPVEKDRGQQ